MATRLRKLWLDIKDIWQQRVNRTNDPPGYVSDSSLGFDEHAVFWEIISSDACPCDPDTKASSNDVEKQRFRPLLGWLDFELLSASDENNLSPGFSDSEPAATSSGDNVPSESLGKIPMDPLIVYTNIAKRIAPEDTAVETVSEALCCAIESTMGILTRGENVDWREGTIGKYFTGEHQADVLNAQWEFNVSDGRIGDDYLTQKIQTLRLNLSRPTKPSTGDYTSNAGGWRLLKSARAKIRAAIALSAYTHEVRVASITGSKRYSLGQGSHHDASVSFQRIVGYQRTTGECSTGFSLDKFTEWLPPRLCR